MSRRTRLNTATGKVDEDGRYGRVPTGMAFADAVGTRRSTLCVTNPRLVGGPSTFDWTQRFLTCIPVSTTRWRMRVANRDRQSTIYTSPGTVTSVWTGLPTLAISGSWRWDGNFTAAPTQVWAGGTIPTDGTELVSPWITATNFTAGQQMLISMGVTVANSGTGVIFDETTQTYRLIASGSSHAGDTVLSGSARTAAGVMFDIRIEYEYAGTEPIGLFVGDSITSGFGDGDTNGESGLHGFESFPGVAGMAGRFNYINAGATAYTAALWQPSTLWIWNRLDLATTVPDFAVIALGTNDISGSLPSGTYKANLGAVVNIVKAKGIKKIFLATIPPRVFPTAGLLTVGASIGATSITSDTNFLGITYPSETTGTIQIGKGRLQETVVVSAASGTGPYTLTVGALGLNHVAGEQITAGKERIRQLMNDFIRGVPYGVQGVVDLDAFIALTPGNVAPDPRIVSTDQLHPLRAGYALIGQAIAQLAA